MTVKVAQQPSGIVIGPLSHAAALAAGDHLTSLLAELGIQSSHCQLSANSYRERQVELALCLSTEAAQAWAPGFDTLELADRLNRDVPHEATTPTGDNDRAALEREILVALLASPVPFNFPSMDELISAIRMRVNLCRAGARTAMDFHTAKVDRPTSEWDYDEDRGFTLREARNLIGALRLTTQPDLSGRLYAFSCYRATEYIILLAIAEELMVCHAGLLRALEAQWRKEAIASGRFHDTFLHELGSNEAPLPVGYYVPGDRVWFRNPDEASADASGYEGSWTMYLGKGLFANMWQRNRPFTLQTKCVEMYHWRDAVYKDAEGDARIDEAVVEHHVRATLADQARTAEVLGRMLRLRDLKGVYADGGCIDRTREGPRWVRPGSTDIPIAPMDDSPTPESLRPAPDRTPMPERARSSRASATPHARAS